MKKILFESEKVYRQAPKNLVQNDEQLFKHEFIRTIPETLYTIATNGYIESTGKSFTGNIFQILISELNKVGFLRAIKRIVGILVKPKKKISKVLYLMDEEASGYFHWIGDVLPRIEGVIRRNLYNSNFTVVVPFNLHFNYVKELLAPFKLNVVYFASKNETIKCKHLISVEKIAESGNYRPDLMINLRNRFLTYFGVEKKPKKIYISRAKAFRRKIENEIDIDSILMKYNISKIFFEELTISEQVRLCASADLIIGLHGAGLSNFLWVKPKTKVVEIRFKEDSHNNCFFSLAAAIELDYYYFLVDKVNNHEDVHNSNALIDKNKFEIMLQSLSE